MECASHLTYDHCHTACMKSCENNTKVSVCKDYPTEGCFCPEGKVVFGDSCVSEEVCTQCVSEDGTHHQVITCTVTHLWQGLEFTPLKVNLFSLWILYFLAQFLIICWLSAPFSSPSVKLAGTGYKDHSWDCTDLARHDNSVWREV